MGDGSSRGRNFEGSVSKGDDAFAMVRAVGAERVELMLTWVRWIRSELRRVETGFSGVECDSAKPRTDRR